MAVSSRFLLLTSWLVVLAGSAHAAPERWLVAAHPAPPFVIEEEDGSYGGLAIALWEKIAEDLGIEYEVRTYALDALFDAVAIGEVDLAIGALTVTKERAQRVEFTHPYFFGGIGVAERWRGEPTWREDVHNLVQSRALRLLGVAAVLLLAFSVLVWLVERRHNPLHFPPNRRGIGDAIWWSGVTMTTVGYGDKAPVTPAGRALALAWMFASLILLAGITGVVASVLTVSHLGRFVDSPDDLARFRLAAVEGSVAANWLDDRALGYWGVQEPEDALALLARGEVEAVVHDAAVLQFLVRSQHTDRLQMSQLSLAREDYAFALPSDSPHREAVSLVLIDHVREGSWPAIRRSYLGR